MCTECCQMRKSEFINTALEDIEKYDFFFNDFTKCFFFFFFKVFSLKSNDWLTFCR